MQHVAPAEHLGAAGLAIEDAAVGVESEGLGGVAGGAVERGEGVGCVVAVEGERHRVGSEGWGVRLRSDRVPVRK